MPAAIETKATLTEQALHAAEQNMTDVIKLFRSHGASHLVFSIAVQDMQNDALKLVKAARKAAPTADERAFKADLLARAETAERHMAEFGALADYYKYHFAEGQQEPSLDQLRKEGFLRA